ncbi:Transposon Ty3-I Gag-Pol poly [Paramuricea clavata]|uniref:Transposon Ty3-I Gag-Pol poly n=1 Tax=Paramuricea clavata TaxID=317549 RepID=A0A7D9D5G1_PARCT|nr:Transposon Ty3-I Gag-Pol poly [Paramuricea clavata]
MQPPESPSEVKSLLGMAQYVSRFIPNYAAITAPLRALTHQNSVWKWDKEEETAFRKLQDELTSDRVMSYFDPTKPTEVLVDARPMGLAAVLMQDGKNRPVEAEINALHYEIIYRPGKDDANPADFISRHPHKATPFPDNIAENCVNYLCNNVIPKAMTMSEVKKETENDSTLQKLLQAIKTSIWSDPEIQPYTNVKDELSECDGILLRGTRLVLPQSLQQQAIELAQAGHQGIVKTKRLLREKVWFPSIDRMVQERIKNCIPCQAATQAPWNEIAIDFDGPFPSGETLLVVIDEFSRFPEVEILHSTTANAVIPKLDGIFSRQGIPKVVKSDNGPPFNSAEFANFASFLGFLHRKVTPYWPLANGEVERFMRTLEKAIRTAHSEKKNWKRISTPLTEVPNPEADNSIHETDSEKKRKMKEYADKRRRSETSEIKVGDTVLIQQPKANKLSTPFNPSPYKVVARKGSMVTTERDSHKVTRNVSFFKKIKATFIPEDATVDESDDPIPHSRHNLKQQVAPPPSRRSQRNRQPSNRLRY